jgi:hypothetical protein
MRKKAKIQEAEVVREAGTNTNTEQMRPERRRRLNRWAVALTIFLVAGYAVWMNWRWMADEYVIWQNPPSGEVTEMAERAMMTDLGRRLFFASAPTLDTAAEFNEHCADRESEMVLLGCYYNGGIFGRIHIFNITDAEIAGAKYVTAAHEMLHAAYARLDSWTKDMLNEKLEEMYQKLDDAELKELMASYEKTEPGEKYNELHSILGTEYAELSLELEVYYEQYFVDQDAVAGLAAQYKKVFRDIENAQKELDTKMGALKAKIEEDRADYEATLEQLNADILAFNAKNVPGGFATAAQFNSERSKLVARETALKSLGAQIRADIDQYNVWVEEFNKLGGRAQELNESFNSQKAAEVEADRG